ncbi:MAG TPA: glycosyltransferase family 39 protein, partial [Gemmatimonadaceae bacterium]|nr:glycosyltransferase family 39 protein [Gemmatimonadaceae bacterium]
MRILLALALAAVALLLPARGTAAALVGADAPSITAVTTGVLILKALLLFHALVLALAPRIRPRGGTGEPLLAWVPADDPRDLSPGQARIALAVILLVGAALRLHDLGAGLWYDEILTLVWYARYPLGYIISTFDSQNQHMLYSVLAHGSLQAFGDSAWALRLPAALFGIASLWATYWFGTMITTRRESLLAAALLAASYHHVWFSQNARGYSGLLFWTLVTSALFLRLLRARDAADARPAWGPTVAYAVTSALAVFTHTSAVFVTVAHFLVWC